jgi:hypothetical protein
LPALDSNAIFDELRDLAVQTNMNASLSSLSVEIFKIQAAKERVSEIITDVIRNYTFKKRAVNILSTSWGKFTKEKNAEGRKGDCAYRMSQFETVYAETETIMQGCNQIMSNLDAQHSALSRRVTLAQMQLKIKEMGLSEEEYNKFFESDDVGKYDNINDSSNSENVEIDVNEGIEPDSVF